MLKVAIIGLGDIYPIHIAAIESNPNVKLVALCDCDETLNNHMPNVNFYTDYNLMLEEEALDCVHICLPHYLHYPVTKACVEKGINVFQEKPVAMNAQEGLELLKLEEAYPNIKICICLQNRFNESFEALEEILESGQYGKLIGVKGIVTWYRPKEYYDVKPWRGQKKYAGGGAMINQSIHTLDLMQLVGGEIEAIRGSVDQMLDYNIEVEDMATAHIRFKNGAIGLYYATIGNAANSSVEFQVVLENGKFTIKDSILTRLNDNDKKEEIIEDAKLAGSKFYYGASHAKLINKFYSCIDDNTDDYVHVKDALMSIRMIDTILKSSELKKEIEMGVL